MVIDMQRIPVKSSNLRTVGYDPTTRTLEIEFKSGGIYQYNGVTPQVYDGLMNAASHGEYFAQSIRDRYPTIKIR